MSGITGFGNAAFRTIYELAFQVSPIILQGGIVSGVPGGAMPIIGLVGQLAGFAQGALSAGGLSTSDFFAQYITVPGGNLISNSVGLYPFANQQVAANAIIEQPLTISLLMIAPVNQTAGYITKLPLFTALQSSLRAHNNAGGTYAVATPAFIYSPCLMTGMTNITSGEEKQQQIEWQIDFIKPLITQQQAAAAYNGYMGKLAGGQQVNGSASWSGPQTAAGSALQGATQGINGMFGAVNSFLSGPAL